MTKQDTEESISDSGNKEAEKAAVAEHSGRGNLFKRCAHWLRSHKKLSIPLGIVVLLAVLAVIPQTRYGIAGLVIKRSYRVVVVDAETHKPVSEAVVTLNGVRATTDGAGLVSLHTKVGNAKVSVSKKYYRNLSSDVLVPLAQSSKAFKIALKAEGRPVPVTVTNKISKQPVSGAVLSAEGAKAKTDKKGKAIFVLPAGKQAVTVHLSGEGFNAAEAALTITSEEVKANTFELTPAGKLYFLSNQSGKIDLVKSNLDGTERQVVLPGTGKEDKANTVLLASRDWKYIALLSKRDGGAYAKLFLIEAGTDKVTVMDEGEAGFTIRGWSDDRFIYSVTRDKVNEWEPKRQALKSYHAPSKKITLLAETTAEGSQFDYASQYIGDTYVLDKEIVYTLGWSGYLNRTNGKQASFNSVRADGSQKRTVKSYPAERIEAATAEFREIYLQYFEPGKTQASHDEYADGKLTPTNLTEEEFYKEDYPLYAVSPSGTYTLWSELRDGKNVFFVGDAKGQNGKQIGASTDSNYSVYGWFSDDYILLTKNSSEMHILPRDGLSAGVETSPKVSDYYKPNYALRGYGYGYGG